MANNQVAGQARVKIDSALLETDGQTKLEIGGPKREPVMGDYQAGSFRQSTEPSKIEVSVLYKEQTDLAAFRSITDATITIEYDTGAVWVIRGGYYSEVASINQQDGKASLVFMGQPAESL
jgi:Phage tail tube protein